MKLKKILVFLSIALILQGCSLFRTPTEEELRVNNIESLLRTACVSSSSSEIGFKLTANGAYELEVKTQTGNANVTIDASVLDRDNQGALNYVNEELRAAQDNQIRSCIKEQMPRILEELRTPEQKSAKCYREKSDAYVKSREFRTNEQTARASGPGWRGGRNTDDARLCYNGIQGYDNIEVSFKRTSCLGGRCRVDPIQTRIENGTAKACVKIKAWSQSHSGGGGGRVAGYLYGNVSRTLTKEIKSSIQAECDSRHNVTSA